MPLDPSDITRQLVELRIEHRDLDSAIAQMADDAHCDEVQLKRMKKRKLRLKDMIAYLESKLIPDLDA
ncbi:MAG: YdcH family protein [Rudaea sp.]